MIHNAHTAFMKERNIMTIIMCLHEILHETKRRKEIGIILKLDFEKAYDNMNWKLLFTCLEKRVFEKKLVCLDQAGCIWRDCDYEIKQ